MANALSYQLIHIHACHEKQINKKRKTKNKNENTYHMALACGRYNARSDWLIVTEL